MSPILVHPDFVEFDAFQPGGLKGFKCLPISVHPDFVEFRRFFSQAVSRVPMSTILVHPDFVDFDAFLLGGLRGSNGI